jgi:hypothetical protein
MSTCRAQGFIFSLGHIASPLYNGSICIYYLIEIKYTHLQRHLNKIEALLHAVPIITALALSISFLAMDGIHPDITTCYIAPYPFLCKYNSAIPCEGGFDDESAISYFYLGLLWGVVPVIIFVSMIMIYWQVAAQETRINRFAFGNRGSRSAHRNTVAARNRAAAYSAAWLITWLTHFCILVIRLTSGDENVPFPVAVIFYITFPLEGLLNFLVYIFPKLSRNLRRQEVQGEMFLIRFALSLRDAITSRGEGGGGTTGSSAIQARRSNQLRHQARTANQQRRKEPEPAREEGNSRTCSQKENKKEEEEEFVIPIKDGGEVAITDNIINEITNQ